MDNIDDVERFHATRPYNGIIEIISDKTGKRICTIHVHDFDTVNDAERMAYRIAGVNLYRFGTMRYLFPLTPKEMPVDKE